MSNSNNCKPSIAPITLKVSQRRNKQNHLASHTREQAKVVIRAYNRRNVMIEKQFQTNMFSVIYERCLQFENI